MNSPFLAHGWRSHAMGFWRQSNGTRSLTHSILISLFIKVKLNTLLLPPLLSITFVPSAFYAYVWHILEGTSKGYIFSRHKRIASRRWVLYKWKYSKEHWQYHLHGMMDLELLKGLWNNWAWMIVVYLDELCTVVPDITSVWRRCYRQECERTIEAWRWNFVQRKSNKPKSLSCKEKILEL